MNDDIIDAFPIIPIILVPVVNFSNPVTVIFFFSHHNGVVSLSPFFFSIFLCFLPADECGSNEGHNKNRNGVCTYRSGDCYSTANLKGKLEGLSTLVVKEDKRTDSFIVFQK